MGGVLDGLNVGQIRAQARADAADTLRTHWPHGATPVEPVTIARSMGASVFRAQLGDDTWGMVIGSGTGIDIYLDVDQSANRYRFSCAHEIGHVVVSAPILREGKALVEKRSEDGRGTADEIYANEFAGSLLMPEDVIRRAIADGRSSIEMAAMFQVSYDSLAYRRQLLGI